jgi:Neprosin
MLGIAKLSVDETSGDGSMKARAVVCKMMLFSPAAVLIALSIGLAQAQPTTAGFVPFNNFIQSVKGANSTDFVARPGFKVGDSAAFEEMRQHILSMYRGVNVSHSYVLDSQTFDCIPINQQPSLRALGQGQVASAPPSNVGSFSSANLSQRPLSQLPLGQTKDKFGNTLGCEDHTIPMSRITLEQLSRFKTLKNFFEKGPNGAGHAPEPGTMVIPPQIFAHKYAFTYQNVDNLGPSTNINLWSPYVDTSQNEVFSLAQLWTVGLSSAPVQTAEAGWQNFPAMYGSENSALFIYWTADGYNNTGCYNLTCPGFVQVDNTYHLGVGFTNYSSFGGSQYEIRLQYDLYQGNWWLRVGDTWIGYYPGSIYQGGQLSQNSNLLEFGSESVGTTVWPGEGSGLWADDGYSYAAYQSQLYYVDTSGTSLWDSLTADVPSPSTTESKTSWLGMIT